MGDIALCIRRFDDGGNFCKSNDDCQGICVTEKRGELEGKCSDDNLILGDICMIEKEGIPSNCARYAPFE